MNQEKSCLVLGAGIAGVTTAIGLKKLGYQVEILYRSRPFSAYEGFSEKTKEGLVTSGCPQAAALLLTQSKRNSNWAGKVGNVNYEYVVSRDEMDRALREDASIKGVELIEASVSGGVDCSGEKPRVLCKLGSKQVEKSADFIVDARGRFTPFKDEYISGPKSFSILQELEIDPLIEAKTSIDSTQDGWVWQAYVGGTKAYIQFTCDENLGVNINTFDELLSLLKKQDIPLWSLDNLRSLKKMTKRDSYSKIHKEIVNDKMILVGDCASSIDPLSGNGAFQAMSMSSVAPYVINTILNSSRVEKESAIAFYKDRVEFIFDKFSRVGRDFYSLEKRYQTPFWIQRQGWPQEKDTQKQIPRIENKSIVKVPFIYPQEIVITKSNPMGVWLYRDIDVVGLAKFCLQNSVHEALVYFDRFCVENKLSEELSQYLKQWLISQEILKTG